MLLQALAGCREGSGQQAVQLVVRSVKLQLRIEEERACSYCFAASRASA
jgi:hypothetical protein